MVSRYRVAQKVSCY